MFEDFSFSSPSSSRPPRLAPDDDRLMTDCDSMISPLSSRCPSPRSSSAPHFPRSRSRYFRSPQHQQLPPTSVPYDHHHRLSIGTLTKKLHEHTIQNSSSTEHPSRPVSPSTPTPPRPSFSSRFPGYVLTPPDTDQDDEGYASPISPSQSLSPTPGSPSLNPTSAPPDLYEPDFPPALAPPADPHVSVRSRRQHISRLQGQYTPSDLETIRRTLLATADEEMRQYNPLLTEACHPSSLPPTQGPRRRRTVSMQRPSRVRSPVSPDPPIPNSGSGVGDTQSRRKSMSNGASTGTGGTLAPTSSSRIEKNYQTSSDRDRGRKKSEASLRRKSMVSAALASMIENGE
ncbi:hypothetical protein BDW62DRAFT_158031 [Aspergillus aurantiobrunneus]